MPAVLKILWQSGPSVVVWSILLRFLVALTPWGIAKVASWIINGVDHVLRGQPVPPRFWWIVGLEVLLAVFTGILSRLIDYCDNLLADRYTHYVSVRVMEQAARLDLTTYEDPVFYDRLERARVQATDRLAMIQQMGRLLQQAVTTLTFSAALLWYSPWLVLLLIVGVLPSFLGETHFAFLGYAKNFRQTPAKRQMDYLRQVGGSREGAKELKLFNLSDYLTDRFPELSEADLSRERRALARKRLFVGGLLAIIGTLGYYGCLRLRHLARPPSAATTSACSTFLTTAIMQASSNMQQVFSTASGIADQALFLTDLIAFFEMKPTVESKPNGLPDATPHSQAASSSATSPSPIPAPNAVSSSNFNFTLPPGERIALIGENGQGKTTIVKLITRLYDPTEGQILLDGVDLRDY